MCVRACMRAHVCIPGSSYVYTVYQYRYHINNCHLHFVGQQLDTCTSGFADPSEGNRERNKRQYIFPFMNFSCHGYIKEWTFYAKSLDNGDQYPEFQIWRPYCSMYMYKKVGHTYIDSSITQEDLIKNELKQHTYIVNQLEPMYFQPGDVVGVYTPKSMHARIQLRFIEENDSPLSYHKLERGPRSEVSLSNLSSTTSDVPMVTVQIVTFIINSTSTSKSLSSSLKAW